MEVIYLYVQNCVRKEVPPDGITDAGHEYHVRVHALNDGVAIDKQELMDLLAIEIDRVLL